MGLLCGEKLHDLNFNRFWLIHPCDGQTDGRQHARLCCRAQKILIRQLYVCFECVIFIKLDIIWTHTLVLNWTLRMDDTSSISVNWLVCDFFQVESVCSVRMYMQIYADCSAKYPNLCHCILQTSFYSTRSWECPFTCVICRENHQ